MVALQLAVLLAAIQPGGETVLLDFSATWCGPCRQMQPVVEQLISQGYPIRKVDLDRERELAARFNVQAVPCFVLVSGGREVGRIVGGTSAGELAQLFARAPAPNRNPATARPTLAPDAQVRMQSPDSYSAVPAAAPAAVPVPLTPAGLAGPLVDVAAPRGALPPQAVMPGQASLAAEPNLQLLAEKLVASTVRLKVDDGNGNSVGSGTIIDARDGEALVLTCAHLFRDSTSHAVTIDMFGAGAPQRVPGKLVHQNLQNDVALVSFRPGVPVQAAHVAAPNCKLEPGAPCINIGCNGGADATARISKITTVNKYLGPDNVQVAGQPVQGRSGGGLFTRDGEVIGVCNAADPSDNEGLYASLPLVHRELHDAGLDTLLATSMSAPSAAMAAQPAPPVMPASMPRPSAMAQTGVAEARQAPQWATMPPATNRAIETPAPPAGLPISAGSLPAITSAQPAAALPANNANGLAASEQALLDEVRKQADGAEVICIVRSRTNPQARSEIIVLDRASPQLLKQLAAEQTDQSDRQLTSLRVIRVHAIAPVALMSRRQRDASRALAVR